MRGGDKTGAKEDAEGYRQGGIIKIQEVAVRQHDALWKTEVALRQAPPVNRESVLI